jgi:starch synthase
MISRIAEQKGFNELLEGSPCALEILLEETPAQMIIIGTGDKRLEEKLKVLRDIHKNLSVNIIFNNRAAHRVEAAADFFLMPVAMNRAGSTRCIPCDMERFLSRVGQEDWLIPTRGYERRSAPWHWILFGRDVGRRDRIRGTNGDALVEQGRPEFSVIRKRAMECDFTWNRSAKAYLDIYYNITSKGK